MRERNVPPPGERLGLSGWLRALGFTGSDEIAPPRRWERLNVALISDEHELTSFTPGPRGTGGGTQLLVAGEHSTFQLFGGTTGARVTFAPSVNVSFRVGGPFAFTVPPGTDCGIDSSDPARACTSRLFRGSVTAAQIPANAATFFATGSWVGQPELWVPPGRVLSVWAITAGATLFAAFVLREPGSASG